MLTRLQLRDFVIVDQAELDFGPGLTALTGETGAGKSIVVDALLLSPAGAAAVTSCARAPSAPRWPASSAHCPRRRLRWLEAQAIEHDGEVMVRRVIGADGRSRAYVNGQLVPIQSLREFARIPDRDPWPAGIPAPGQARRAARAARRARREPALIAAVAERLRSAIEPADASYEALHTAADEPRGAARPAALPAGELKAEVGTRRRIEELFVERSASPDAAAWRGGARRPRPRSYEDDGASAHDLLAKAPSGAARRGGHRPRAGSSRRSCWREATIHARRGRRDACATISMRWISTRRARTRSSGVPPRSRRSPASIACACSSCRPNVNAHRTELATLDGRRAEPGRYWSSSSADCERDYDAAAERPDRRRAARGGRRLGQPDHRSSCRRSGWRAAGSR